MRDNFAKGQYPTLEERIDFAMNACDYVEKSLAKTTTAPAVEGAVVSFSFVNTDLRDIFRERFPAAQWYLMDTSEQEAADRILQRQGHFYKGKVVDVDDESSLQKPKDDESPQRPESDNKDWDFAPVTFDHVVLDGTQSVSKNADIVATGLLQKLAQQNVP